jgi:dipeptidyl aminopeptidase/acylaminoacyl peptidase
MAIAESLDLRARYGAAERLLPHRWKDLIVSGRVQPNWVHARDLFWYSRTTAAGDEWLIVDASAGLRELAFDCETVAQVLSVGLERAVDPAELPIDSIELLEQGGLGLHIEGQTWSWDGATLVQTPMPAPKPLFHSLSPDSRLMVSVVDHNLVLCERKTGVERALTSDGRADFGYGDQPDISTLRFTLDLVGLRMPPAVIWSPDSRWLVAHRIDQRGLPLMHYVQSSPPDGGRPRLFSEHYAMAGDEATLRAELVVVDVATGKLTWANIPPLNVAFMAPISANEVWWARDSKRLYFLSGARGDQVLSLYALDPASGETRLLVKEQSETQVQVHPIWGSHPNVHVLGTGEILWWSERSGWGHLYLYGPDGSVRPLTSGEWLVRDLVAVNEEKRELLFSASGRERTLDPYVRQLYRLELDSGEVERLSHDALDHDVVASPSGSYAVDVSSWLDVPERSSLRNGRGEVVLDLEKADATQLYEAGWAPPERFTVKAADGETDLYGLLYVPHDFDSALRYPVLDDIYPGPQIGAATIRFCERGTAEHAASMAALGFAVVVVDGRGTPLRNKAFQEWCRGQHGGDYLDDHVAAIRQLAAKRPWLDLARVGIYGHSGGGRASVQALLRHPDFYKVGVAVAGNHDDEIYHPGWSEKYVGHPREVDYRNHANSPHADRLHGKLLLIHGELDNNVHPYMTLRLADALMTANKDFDLLLVPNADHALLVHKSYWLRRRWDFFVRHLHGEQPPEYCIADIPIDVAMLLEALT